MGRRDAASLELLAEMGTDEERASSAGGRVQSVLGADERRLPTQFSHELAREKLANARPSASGVGCHADVSALFTLGTGVPKATGWR